MSVIPKSLTYDDFLVKMNITLQYSEYYKNSKGIHPYTLYLSIIHLLGDKEISDYHHFRKLFIIDSSKYQCTKPLSNYLYMEIYVNLYCKDNKDIVSNKSIIPKSLKEDDLIKKISILPSGYLMFSYYNAYLLIVSYLGGKTINNFTEFCNNLPILNDTTMRIKEKKIYDLLYPQNNDVVQKGGKLNNSKIYIISKKLEYRDFLNMVWNIKKEDNNGSDVYYDSLYKNIINRLGGVSIQNYNDFINKCGNLGNINYLDLYKKLYMNKK